MNKLFLSAFLCVGIPQLFAAPPATYDGFNYPPVGNTTWAPTTASNLNAQGYFWNAVGTATPTPAIPITSQNLSYPGLLPATGLSIRLVTNGNSARFSFPAGSGVTSGTLYYSFLY